MTKTATNETPERELMGKFEEVLRKLPLRIELGFGFGVKGTRPTATFYTKNENNRWVEFKPFLAGELTDDHGNLLQRISNVWRQAAGQPKSGLWVEEATNAAGGTVWHIWDRFESDEDRVLLAVIHQSENGPILHTEHTWASHHWTPVELEHVAMFMRSL